MVQSLAKWKRKALKRYDFQAGKGLYSDMNAIRRDEELDNLHSVYVDQWDWEKVIRGGPQRGLSEERVRSIVAAVCATETHLHAMFPQLQDLPLDRRGDLCHHPGAGGPYPDLTPKERENAFVRSTTPRS